MDYAEDWEWAFTVLGVDEKLGRHATADDFTPFTPRQMADRDRAGGHSDPAVRAIYRQVPALQDMLGVELHVDHIFPVSRGGKTIADNLQIVPKDVNLRKNDKLVFKYGRD